MISAQEINMAHTAQTIYLEKLQKVLKDDLTETESKIKGDVNVDTILEKQLKRLQGEVYFSVNVLICLKLSLYRLTIY